MWYDHVAKPRPENNNLQDSFNVLCIKLLSLNTLTVILETLL